VPRAGDYFVDVKYLQDAGAFNYLGYAQAHVNGVAQGDWWDQHGLTRALMTHHLGRVPLKAGANTVRFESVWRNGYGSGDYDITLDRIELAAAPALQPAPNNAAAQMGMSYQIYPGGDWTRLPDFSKLKPAESGSAPTFDLSIAENFEQFGVRFSGVLEVPHDGIYSFATQSTTAPTSISATAWWWTTTACTTVRRTSRGRSAATSRCARAGTRCAWTTLKAEARAAPSKCCGRLWGRSCTALSPPLWVLPTPSCRRAPWAPTCSTATPSRCPCSAAASKGNDTLEESGTWPQPWSANMWNKDSIGQIALEKDPVTQRNAIVLRNLEGAPSIQFYTWKNIDLAPGRYEMRLDYMTGGDAAAELISTSRAWTSRPSLCPPAPKRGSDSPRSSKWPGLASRSAPQFRPSGAGADNALYLRGISMLRIEEPKSP
jgi:hypothetical protein